MTFIKSEYKWPLWYNTNMVEWRQNYISDEVSGTRNVLKCGRLLYFAW